MGLCRRCFVLFHDTLEGLFVSFGVATVPGCHTDRFIVHL